MNTYQKFLKPVIAGVAIFAALGLVIMINITQSYTDKADVASGNLTYFADFELGKFDGGTFTQDDFKDYKVTVINGWGPWCNPCTGEMPELDALNDEYKSKGLQVVGVVADYYQKTVSSDDDTAIDEAKAAEYNAEIRKIIDNTGCKYPILLADKAFAEGPFLTMKNSFPCTWAVDSEGNLIEIVSGARTPEKWRELFDKWLAGR